MTVLQQAFKNVRSVVGFSLIDMTSNNEEKRLRLEKYGKNQEVLKEKQTIKFILGQGNETVTLLENQVGKEKQDEDGECK